VVWAVAQQRLQYSLSASCNGPFSDVRQERLMTLDTYILRTTVVNEDLA
jgi:hypothetical protein